MLLPITAYVILLAGYVDKFNASVSAGLQTGVLEGESNILFMLADVNKPMKRGRHLATFVSGTQVMRREKFDG